MRIFNQYPALPLNPPEFLSSLLDSILAEPASETFPVLIEAVYNILSLQPSLLGQIEGEAQTKLQNVVSIILNDLQTRPSWEEFRLLKNMIMVIRLLANSKSSPLLSFSSDQVITPLVKVIFIEYNFLLKY